MAMQSKFKTIFNTVFDADLGIVGRRSAGQKLFGGLLVEFRKVSVEFSNIQSSIHTSELVNKV